MKVLVTGGAGYIGSITTENLIAQGHEVAVFDNLYQGHRAAVHPKAVFVRGDLAVKAEISAALRETKWRAGSVRDRRQANRLATSRWRQCPVGEGQAGPGVQLGGLV